MGTWSPRASPSPGRSDRTRPGRPRPGPAGGVRLPVGAGRSPGVGLDLLQADVVLGHGCGGRFRGGQVVEAGPLDAELEEVVAGRSAAARSSRWRSPGPARPGAGRWSTRRPAARWNSLRYQAARASASTRTSATARFMPLAPVGGTMWAASPARNSRPKRIGSTELRMPVTPLSIGPSSRVQPSSVASRARFPLPDAPVRPAPDRLVRVDLEVEGGEPGRAHAVEGEAAVGGGVDDLLAGGGDRGQHAQPGERVKRTPGRAAAGAASRQTLWNPSQRPRRRPVRPGRRPGSGPSGRSPSSPRRTSETSNRIWPPASSRARSGP